MWGMLPAAKDNQRFRPGMGDQVLVQLTGVLAIAVWSGVITFILLKIADALAGLRATAEEETEGLDTVLHNEKGYNL